jgi:hypothetical protein
MKFLISLLCLISVACGLLTTLVLVREREIHLRINAIESVDLSLSRTIRIRGMVREYNAATRMLTIEGGGWWNMENATKLLRLDDETIITKASFSVENGVIVGIRETPLLPQDIRSAVPAEVLLRPSAEGTYIVLQLVLFEEPGNLLSR